MRELDRERTTLQRQEKKIIADCKRAAKDGQMGAARVMAKDLVRTRKYIQKFYQMRAQLQAVSLRIQVRIICVCVCVCGWEERLFSIVGELTDFVDVDVDVDVDVVDDDDDVCVCVDFEIKPGDGRVDGRMCACTAGDECTDAVASDSGHYDGV